MLLVHSFPRRSISLSIQVQVKTRTCQPIIAILQLASKLNLPFQQHNIHHHKNNSTGNHVTWSTKTTASPHFAPSQESPSIVNYNYFMNFQSRIPVDTLLGRLLAFVIMFQKKIETLKCKLAGNEEFHTRLAFQRIDQNKTNQITAFSLCQALRSSANGESQLDCQFFIRKFSRNGSLAYDDFLKIITPKSSKLLSQRIMIRTYKRGAVLEDYLFKILMELLQHYVKMSVVTQSIRKAIQKSQDLSHLEIIEFFHLRISSPSHLIAFLNRCDEDGQEYDIQPSDAIFLSYHIKSGNEIGEFTDLDIKELICPIDMSYQKAVQTRETFYKQTPIESDTKYQTKGTNFLGKTYQKMYQQPSSIKSSQAKFPIDGANPKKPLQNHISPNTNRFSSRIQASLIDQSYNGLYIDNFARSDIRTNLQLNKYAEFQPKRAKQDVVVFQDDLSNRSSVSRGTAFDQS